MKANRLKELLYNKKAILGLVVFLSFALAGTGTYLVLHSRASVTQGDPNNPNFPRLSAWWMNSTPLTTLAKLNFYVPYEWEPTKPDTTRIATLRSLNPNMKIFADASAVELNYRQPDATGKPQGDPSYDSERIGAIPTSWILTQVGTTTTAPVAAVATPAQSTITVADSTKFFVGNLAIMDDEKMYVSAVGSGNITVLRGWAGSTAATHASGVRVAPAATSWPFSIKLDITDECPKGTASGKFATPTGTTESAVNWMARRTAGHFKAASFDGVYIDLCGGYISWFKGTTPNKQYKTIAQRSNPTLEITDYSAFDTKWAAGETNFQTILRSQLPASAIVLGNEVVPAFQSINGGNLENKFDRNATYDRWKQVIIGPYKSNLPSYLEYLKYSRDQKVSTLQFYASATDYQFMRFTLASTLMGNGYFNYRDNAISTVPWFDEYDGGGLGQGYLGLPSGDMSQVGTTTVYRRDYQNGVALVNPGDAAVTVSLGNTYNKIKGTQAPSINDGSSVTSVTLQPKDGIILLKTGVAAAPPTTTLTNPTNGSTVSGNVSVTASVTDNVAISKVEFYVDGNLNATTSTAPYNYNLDTTKISNGSHTIKAKAYNSLNLTSESSASVSVSNTTTVSEPVKILSPLNNSSITGSANITTFIPTGVNLSKVEFYIDNTLKKTDTSSPFSYYWGTSKTSNGLHTITVKAYNSSGALHSSDSISVTVSNIFNRWKK